MEALRAGGLAAKRGRKKHYGFSRNNTNNTCCASPGCTHSRFFCQSCKSKACSACGMKSTEQWVAEQQHVLPDCEWQHITYTMPHLLWPFFNNNWPLHTYGHQLNQHPHIHVSVTRGGLDVKHGVWRSLFFKKKAVEIIWRSAVIRLLRGSYERIMPGGSHPRRASGAAISAGKYPCNGIAVAAWNGEKTMVANA